MPALRSCPICLGNQAETLAEVPTAESPLRIVICQACALVYANPMFSDAEKSVLSPSMRGLHRSRSAEQTLARAYQKSMARARRCIELVRPHLRAGDRVLEVGCGDGAVLKLLSGLGTTPVGLDPDVEAARFIEKSLGVPVTAATVEQARFAEQSFDAVVMVHLIEHLAEPVVALARIRRWLKPGGMLLVETPNILRPKVGPRRVFSFAHNYHFSPRTLALALERAGFVPRRIRVFRRDGVQVVAQAGPDSNGQARIGPEPWREVAARVRSHRARYLGTLQFLWRKLPWLRERLIYGVHQDLCGTALEEWLAEYPPWDGQRAAPEAPAHPAAAGRVRTAGGRTRAA